MAKKLYYKSVDQLVSLLQLLGYDVDLAVRKSPRKSIRATKRQGKTRL